MSTSHHLPPTVARRLEVLAARAAEYGQRLPPTASTEEVRDLCRRSATTLGSFPPDEYLRFLRWHNGLDWNGLCIYSTARVLIDGYRDRWRLGYVEENLSHRDGLASANVLVLGEAGDDVCVFDARARRFDMRDRISRDVHQTHRHFDGLLSAALKAHW